MKVFSLQSNRKIFPVFLILMLALFSQVVLAADIMMAPVPWAPESSKASRGNFTDGISFINVPSEGEILIYTISGQLVRHIEFKNNTTGRERWYGKNDNDEYVASGVYLWVLKSSQGTKTGKLIILR
jgi:flagellar hook assembly protein FlgD